MKRFLVSILCVSVFFIGLGAIAENVGANLKSDEKALEIIKRARTAIGGEAAVAEVRSLVIKGQTTKTILIDGEERVEQGETEIALQLPDKMMKMVTLGNHDGADGDRLIEKSVDVVVVGGDGEHKVITNGDEGEFTTDDGKKIVIRKSEGADAKDVKSGETKIFVRKADGEKGEWKTNGGEVKEINTSDGKRIIIHKAGDANPTWISEDGKHATFEKKLAGAHGAMRQNELLRTALALLLTAPKGMDVSYTYAGESTIDGISVNTVVASFGGSSFRMYFDISSYLPVAMSYAGHPEPVIVRFKKENADLNAAKDSVVFNKRFVGQDASVEHFVRFSDFRNTNGVQLPYKWTTTIADKTSEVFDVTSYDLNPADIGDRFKDHKVKVRSAKPSQK